MSKAKRIDYWIKFHGADTLLSSLAKKNGWTVKTKAETSKTSVVTMD
jgi:hypothetical protein